MSSNARFCALWVLAACLMERKLERFDKTCTWRVEVKEWKKRLRRSEESER